jgi:peptidyl-prolyl cis-trans isomerase B (cyclophilin B)
MVNQGYLDSLSFYRVVNNFLIQTGMDLPDDMPQLIDKEISGDLFHKRGAVNAARGDDDLNPEQASANFHFTIIQGRIYTDSLLDISERRINNWIAYNHVIHKPENSDLFAHLQDMYNSGAGRDSIMEAKKQLNELAGAELGTMEKYRIPADHREVYKTIGGAAHLDYNYTVFGQVVKGMEVVDEIAAVETDRSANPLDDIYILGARMIKRIDYNSPGN